MLHFFLFGIFYEFCIRIFDISPFVNFVYYLYISYGIKRFEDITEKFPVNRLDDSKEGTLHLYFSASQRRRQDRCCRVVAACISSMAWRVTKYEMGKKKTRLAVRVSRRLSQTSWVLETQVACKEFG